MFTVTTESCSNSQRYCLRRLIVVIMLNISVMFVSVSCNPNEFNREEALQALRKMEPQYQSVAIPLTPEILERGLAENLWIEMPYFSSYVTLRITPQGRESFRSIIGTRHLKRTYFEKQQVMGNSPPSPGLVLLMKREIDAVTGITDMDAVSKLAFFTWKTSTRENTDIAKLAYAYSKGVKEPSNAILSSDPENGRALFRKFDDGWRVDGVRWEP